MNNVSRETLCQLVKIPEIVAVALMVCCGYYGNGEERKEALEADGYDYETVQKCTNDLIEVIQKYGT